MIARVMGCAQGQMSQAQLRKFLIVEQFRPENTEVCQGGRQPKKSVPHIPALAGCAPKWVRYRFREFTRLGLPAIRTFPAENGPAESMCAGRATLQALPIQLLLYVDCPYIPKVCDPTADGSYVATGVALRRSGCGHYAGAAGKR
jgi:hypothetical protein